MEEFKSGGKICAIWEKEKIIMGTHKMIGMYNSMIHLLQPFSSLEQRVSIKLGKPLRSHVPLVFQCSPSSG